MTATTRSAECRAPGTTLMLAFDLGSTKWTLGFTTAPAQRPRLRTMPAGDLVTLVQEIQWRRRLDADRRPLEQPAVRPRAGAGARAGRRQAGAWCTCPHRRPKQHDDRERDAHDRDQCPRLQREAAEELTERGEPRHHPRRRDTQRLQDGCEPVGSLTQFGVSMRREAESDHQPQGQQRPPGPVAV